MFVKSSFVALAAVASVYGRFLIPEREGRAIFPRRFGQEQCGGLPGRLGSACQGDVCGVLGGKTISTLLAAAPECAQQDLADEIINASKDQDAATAANMVALAIEFRQCEKNTPPDFTANPPALRNSVFCQKAPLNAELNGLVQAQDPANDPTLFFDPATKSTVLAGSQANTVPFGGAAAVNNVVNVVDPAVNVIPAANDVENLVDVNANCPAPVVVTVTVGADQALATEPAAANIEIIDAGQEVQNVQDAGAVSLAGALDFGDCTNPGVDFSAGFNGRKASEFTFQPVDQQEFQQGEAKNGNIVFNAICNILADKCNAGDATNAACEAAKSAAAALSGAAAADAFNAGLGIQSNFVASVAQIGADFGSCDAPNIAFGIFDGRKENSFAPVGDGFDHGSALNAGIITRFVCDQLVNGCDANQAAIDGCEAAIDATQGQSGQALADAFNAAIQQA